MKKVLIAFLALFGVFCLMAVVVLMGLGMLAAMTRERMPSRAVLDLDFNRGVVETLPEDPFALFSVDERLELRDVVDAIDRAADDRRIVGLFARIGGAPMGMAQIQEVRDAVGRFRESGKPAVAFAESFGEFGPGNGGYYLASAFDDVYLQPSGNVGLTGLMYESPFIRGLLEKLHLEPSIGQRYEYKNAVNFYTETGFTEAHREAMQDLMDSQFGQIVRGVAEARGMTDDEALSLFDEGPFIGSGAVEAGLVDELLYRDEAFDVLLERADEDEVDLLGPKGYLRRVGRPHRKGDTIALIYGHGTVMQGRSGYSPIDGSITLGSDTVGQAFRDAVDDRRVQAILFRVDSPGGSFVASDTIWRETIRAREAGKPVIVSMGNLAGSGGYYVAMHADKIVAQPGTITASIGVYGGKFMTREFWETHLGVTWDEVHTSEHSRMWSARFPWEEGGDRFDAMLDRVYRDFTGKVSDGRGIDPDRVHEIARGRIWTGEDALELGLVDELGGMDVAIDLIREEVGLEPDAPVRLKRFPRPRSALELLFERSAADAAALQLAGAMSETVRPMVRTLRALGVLEQPGVLTMPDVPARIQ